MDKNYLKSDQDFNIPRLIINILADVLRLITSKSLI